MRNPLYVWLIALLAGLLAAGWVRHQLDRAIASAAHTATQPRLDPMRCGCLPWEHELGHGTCPAEWPAEPADMITTSG